MNRFYTILALLICSLAASAQDVEFPKIEGFKLITEYPVYSPDNLWDFINGAADNYLALGFQDLHVAEYKKGKESIKLEIYRHENNTMAFGIYASERSSSYNFVNLGSQGYNVDGVINFFKGNYYIKIKTYSTKEKTLHATESLAVRVAEMIPGESEMPSLLLRLPDEGKKVNEETYINESVLGYTFLNKAFRAVYQVGNDTFDLYLIKCSSPQEAIQSVNSYLKTTGMDPDNSESGKIVVADKYNGNIFLSWKGEYIILISGLQKDQADIAEKYTADILN